MLAVLGNDGNFAYVFLVILLAPYIFGPLIVKLTQKSPAKPPIEVMDPDAPIPPDVEKYFAATGNSLASAGFGLVGRMMVTDLAPGLTSFLSVMENKSVQDLALATVVLGKDMQTPKVAYIEFSNSFTDGTVVNTNNSSQSSAFARLAHKKVLQVPEELSPLALYHIHTAMLEKFGRGKAKRSEDLRDLAAFLRGSVLKEFSGQFRSGYYYVSADRQWYKPTWKGACLMTWKLCWPMKAIRESAAKKERTELLQSLDLAGQSARV